MKNCTVYNKNEDSDDTIIRGFIASRPSGKYTKPPSTVIEALARKTSKYGISDDAPIAMRIWHYLNGSRPLCLACGAETHWNHTEKTYRQFCSAKCANTSETKIQKIRQTNTERYGVAAPIQSSQIKEKIVRTNLERYGSEYYINTEEFKRRSSKSLEEKYGVVNPGQMPHVKELNRKRLVENPIVSEQHPMHKEMIKEKFRETCIAKLGVDGVVNKESFVEYLFEQHHEKRLTCKEIADAIGVHISTVCKWFDRLGVEKKVFFSSSEQRELENFIGSLGLKYQSNVRNIIDGELDIVVPDRKIAIEYCGLYWHCNQNKPTGYHSDKLQAANAAGYRLITIFQDEWLHSKEIVKQKLKHIFGADDRPTVYARKTIIDVVADYEEVKQFFNENHIQGASNGFVTLGLKHQGHWVAMMTFKEVRSRIVQLTRYATSCRVIGGLSKLLRHFERYYEYDTIETFADLRWSEGDVYERTGFTCVKTIKPDYYYIIGTRRLHKFNFRHSRLKRMEGYDPTLSESDNTQKMGIYKIYDCGKKKYVKSRVCVE